jgi:FdhD protein
VADGKPVPALLPEGAQRVPTRRLSFDGAPNDRMERAVPIECPVAVEYNGIGYAVMMATPTDLTDFVIGFTVSEGLATASDISTPQLFETEGGVVVRCNLPTASLPRIMERARNRVSESGCGICGIDSIAAALAPLPQIGYAPQATAAAVRRALDRLYDHQHLGRATGASHAAAYCNGDGDILCVREDVGRHNALDKLIGAIAKEGLDARHGFVLLSARCSQELVEKMVRAGLSMLVTISAPSSLAVDRAREAGLTLITLARSDSALVMNDPHGLFSGDVGQEDPIKIQE